LFFFLKRIPHFYLIKEALTNFFHSTSIQTFYSGEKESRWGIISNELSRKFDKKSTCIPHGLEYAYKFPLGIFGDSIYVTSSEVKNTYKRLYQNKKIVYDPKVIFNMFYIPTSDKMIPKNKIVYFTEGRNIKRDEFIINTIIGENIFLNLKFHPTDKYSNYKFLNEENINVISSFNEAITYNICIARSSTILIEAINNNSKAISVLIYEEDKFYCNFLYPSLSTSQILKIYDMSILLDTLKKFQVDNKLPFTNT